MTSLIRPIREVKLNITEEEEKKKEEEKEKSKSGSPALFIGNIFDSLAKNIFQGNRIDPNAKVKIELPDDRVITQPLVEYFNGKDQLEAVVKEITAVRDALVKEGYIFATDVFVYNEAADVSGEIDVLLIKS